MGEESIKGFVRAAIDESLTFTAGNHLVQG
jgi:hypothetical protein